MSITHASRPFSLEPGILTSISRHVRLQFSTTSCLGRVAEPHLGKPRRGREGKGTAQSRPPSAQGQPQTTQDPTRTEEQPVSALPRNAYGVAKWKLFFNDKAWPPIPGPAGYSRECFSALGPNTSIVAAVRSFQPTRPQVPGNHLGEDYSAS
jgi:hypothetical protein